MPPWLRPRRARDGVGPDHGPVRSFFHATSQAACTASSAMAWSPLIARQTRRMSSWWSAMMRRKASSSPAAADASASPPVPVCHPRHCLHTYTTAWGRPTVSGLRKLHGCEPPALMSSILVPGSVPWSAPPLTQSLARVAGGDARSAAAFEATESVALLAPLLVGAKDTSTLQELPAATVAALQVLAPMTNWLGFEPTPGHAGDADRRRAGVGEGEGEGGRGFVPTSWLPKPWLPGMRVAVRCAPVPLSPELWAAASEVMSSVAVLAPTVVGAKVTSTVQALPAATVAPLQVRRAPRPAVRHMGLQTWIGQDPPRPKASSLHISAPIGAPLRGEEDREERFSGRPRVGTTHDGGIGDELFPMMRCPSGRERRGPEHLEGLAVEEAGQPNDSPKPSGCPRARRGRGGNRPAREWYGLEGWVPSDAFWYIHGWRPAGSRPPADAEPVGGGGPPPRRVEDLDLSPDPEW